MATAEAARRRIREKLPYRIPSLLATAALIFCLLVALIAPTATLTVSLHGVTAGDTLTLTRSDDKTMDDFYRVEAPLDEGAVTRSISGYPFRATYTILTVVGESRSFTLDSVGFSVLGLTVSRFDGAALLRADMTGENMSLTLQDDGLQVTAKDGESAPYIAFRLGRATLLKEAAVYGAALLLLSAVAAGLLNLLLSRVKNYEHWALLLLSAALAVIAGEFFDRGLGYMNASFFLFNLLFASALFLALSAVTNLWVGSLLGTLILGLFYAANFYVIRFRGRPVLPTDLYALGEAADAAGGYQLTLRFSLLAMCAADAAAVALNILVNRKRPFRYKLWQRGVTLAAAAVLFVCAWNSAAFAGAQTMGWDLQFIYCYKEQGGLLSFLKYWEVSQMGKPQGYSRETVVELYGQYRGASETADGVQPDRILMIMNESYSDMDYFTGVIDLDDMDFYKSLSEQSIQGQLYVSVRGGGTCNTEFEALTGNAIAFFPTNFYIYPLYLKRNTWSLGRYMAGEDYEVASLHLAKAGNWKRDTVYRYLGLEPFHAREEYSGVPTVNNDWATDAYDYLCLEEIDAAMGEGKHFLFNVTTQNHGGYTDPRNVETVYDLSDYGDFAAAEVYFSLIKLSDEALRELIEYYEATEGNTMIVLFGDHQPALTAEEESVLFADGSGALDKYMTPFMIWTNYGLEAADAGAVSANYLPYLILKAANLPLTPYLRLTGAVYERYPVITSYGVYDAEGNFYASVDEVPDEEGLLQSYRFAQYNNMFDANRLDAFFNETA